MTKPYSSQIEPIKCKSTSFKPLAGQFLGQLERKDKSDGGIIYSVPDTTWWVDVIGVGPDCDFGSGDRVLVEEYRGENIAFLDGLFTVFESKQALAVEEKE